MYQLELVDTASGARRSVPLLGDSLLIGSAVDCDLVLPSPRVAAHHCRIRRTESGFRLAHVASSAEFETLVNGSAVAVSELALGEVLRIGPFQLVVVPAQIVGAAAAPAASAAIAAPPLVEPLPEAASVASAPELARSAPRLTRPAASLRPGRGTPAAVILVAVAAAAIGLFVLLRDDSSSEPSTPASSATSTASSTPRHADLNREEEMRGFTRARPTDLAANAPKDPVIAPAAPPVDRTNRTATDDAATPAAPAPGERAAPSSPPQASSSALALQAKAREQLLACEFADAKQLLELALDSGAPADLKAEIARDHERAARPLALANRLAEIVATRAPANAPELRTCDGRSGKLVRGDGTQFVLRTGNGEERVAPTELEPASLLDLAGHVPLTAEESLDRAFLALACRDEKAFFGSVDKAAADAAAGSALRASIDSALAFERGLDRVPSRGFVRTGDQWLTWEEKAEEDLRREIHGTLAAALAPKADAAKARAQMLELAGTAPALVVAELTSERVRLSKSFANAPEQKKLAKLRDRLLELKQARKYALELIFDEVKYFYPYEPPACPPDKAGQYAEVQREVDLRVDAVRAIWGAEDAEPPEPHVTLSAALAEDVRELKLLRQMLYDVGRPRDGDDATLLPAWCLPENAKTVHLRNFALDEYERSRLDQDVKVSLLNASVLPADHGPTREELEQVLDTNRYRAMLGRRVLAYNAKLWTAARGHSDWMSRVGRLSHFEDDPERASPEQRMKLAGYDHGAGENCAVGRSGPLEVLVRWCHSSGHHRNLLYESHTEMGAGQSGNYWTQCFGGGREYKGNLVHD